jgi:hypothetical protein
LKAIKQHPSVIEYIAVKRDMLLFYRIKCPTDKVKKFVKIPLKEYESRGRFPDVLI